MSNELKQRPSQVRFEHELETLGSGVRSPRLSWTWPAQTAPTAWQIEILAPDGQRSVHDVSGPDHILTSWPAAPLRSRDRRAVRVRAVNAHGTVSDWSTAGHYETGLLEGSDWSAHFIGPVKHPHLTPVLQRSFHVNAGTTAARLYVAYLGVGYVTINGTRVGSDELAPGWTDYTRRLASFTYEVTSLLRAGENRIDIHLAPGWYAGRLGFLEQRAIYGDHVGAIAQLEFTDASGHRTICTDETWSYRRSAVLEADLYDGETYDARREEAFGTQRLPIDVIAAERAILEPRLSPPVRVQQVLRAKELIHTPAGKWILDFGQNVVGRVKIHGSAEAGTTVVLRHAEVLEDGELGLRPLRTAQVTDRYTFAGRLVEEWAPSFTYHGFRYVEIEGWPGGKPDISALSAEVLHSSMRRTGWFSTSHADIARLHENVVWSMRGNFLSIPTDCPQRDERLGWTGDIAVFARTANFLFDTTALLDSWLRDLSNEQGADGTVPYFVPSLPFPPDKAENPYFSHRPTAVWGDAATIVPTRLFEATGDAEVLSRQYESMTRWVRAVERWAGPTRVWDTGFQYGDWLDPQAPPEDPAAGATETSLVATAFFAYSAALTAQAASVLGRSADHDAFRQLASEVRKAFQRRFITEEGLLTSDSQTAYAIALELELVDGDTRTRAGDRLTELVRHNRHLVGTGFVGTPLVLHALTRAGAVDDAYRMLLQTECPSWLYAVTMGATTMWERWDSMLADGTINPGEMTSFNHYAFGAVADWLHSTVGGLQPLEPGWRRVRVAPRPGLSVRDAEVAHETPYGVVSVSWRMTEHDVLVVDVVLPEGVHAVIDLPGTPEHSVGPGEHTFYSPFGQVLPGGVAPSERVDA